jgi:hypothetical protein
MYLHVTFLTKCFITHITAIWTFTSMYTLMYLQDTLCTECFITHITAIWMLTSMYTLMYLQDTLCTEYFTTHITVIRTLLSMYTLMYLQTNCVPKCFMTHITCIWTFRSMYPLLKRKKVSNITILKRGKRYEIWVTNQLHKNYLTRHVLFYQIPLRTTNVDDYGTLKVHEPNAPFPVTRH